MHPEVNSDFEPPLPEANSVVVLNVEKFNIAMFALGLPESDASRARFIGVDHKTIGSAMAGNPVGWRMIGRTINTLRPYQARLARVGLTVDLNTFFEVPEPVTVDPLAPAVA